MSDDSSTLTEGKIHDILRNDRRRAVIDFLTEHDGHATIRDLSEHIAAIESGEDPPPRNIRQSVYVSLHQTHLPKLEGLGVVDYDTDSKDVELRERADRLQPYMSRTSGSSGFPIAELCLAIGLLGVLFSIVAVAGGSSVIGFGPVVWALPLFVIVAGLGGYGLWNQR